jgi:hypothetical protein
MQTAARESSHEEIVFVLSVDTEEDAWGPTREPSRVRNIEQLPRFHDFVRGFGVRPTYFVTYQVLEHPEGRKVIQSLGADPHAELATHLHPWNTPPLEEAASGRNSMLCNLPLDLQRRKLIELTERFTEVAGRAPTSFRAGRFGMSAALLPSLLELGYLVDSSVTPFWNWEPYDAGPNHWGASVDPYRLSAAAHDIRAPNERGELVELPISVGFTRRPFGVWGAIHDVLQRPWLKTLRAPGIAARLGIVRKAIISPENETARNMLDVSRQLVASGARYVHMFLHSSSLLAGLSPSARNEHEVRRLYSRLGTYLTEIGSLGSVRFATATEAARPYLAIDAAPPTSVK